MSPLSRRIVDQIVADLAGRAPFGPVWILLDPEAKKAMRAAWAKIVDEEMGDSDG